MKHVCIYRQLWCPTYQQTFHNEHKTLFLIFANFIDKRKRIFMQTKIEETIKGLKHEKNINQVL